MARDPQRSPGRERPPDRWREPAHQSPPGADSSALLLLHHAATQTVDGAEQQEFYRPFAATHDQANLLVTQAAFEFEQDRFALIQWQLADGPMQFVALLPPQPQSLRIILPT